MENAWTQKTSMPAARHFLGPAVVEGKIYIIGGTAKQITVSIVFEFDPGLPE